MSPEFKDLVRAVIREEMGATDAPTPPDDEELTTAEASDLSGKSIRWLQQARHFKDQPRFIRRDGKVRYRRSDLIQWMEGCDE